MAGVSSEPEATWESFARQWLATLVALLLRTVHDPALAFDLATETLARAATTRDVPPPAEHALVDVINLAARVLTEAAARGRVPATERRRRGRAHDRLTVENLRELAALAEHPLDMPPPAHEAADELARTAPPPPVLRALEYSGLVHADPLPEPAHSADDA